MEGDSPGTPFTETAQSREVESQVRTVLAKKFRPVRDGAVLVQGCDGLESSDVSDA